MNGVVIYRFCRDCQRSERCPKDVDALSLLCSYCGGRMQLRSSLAADGNTGATLNSTSIQPAAVFPIGRHGCAAAKPSRSFDLVLAEYPIRPHSLSHYSFIAWVFLALGLSAGVVVSGVFLTQPVFPAWGAPVSLLGSLAILFSMGFGTLWRSQRDRCVRVYHAGLTYTQDGRTTEIRWNQIRHFWQHVETRFNKGRFEKTIHHYRMRSEDGKELVFDDRFQNVGRLGATIAEETFNVLMPEALVHFRDGRIIDFGPLSLSGAGLHKSAVNRREFLRWEELNNIDFNEISGAVTINRKRGTLLRWWSGGSGAIPNFHVFLQLVESKVGISRTSVI